MQYTIRGKILNLNPNQQGELTLLMRKFQSARRFAHNRLLEGENKKELVPLLQQMFIPNARYCQWAVNKAEEGIASQKELLPLYVSDLEAKIERSQAKLEKVRSEKKRRGLQARIEKLKRERYKYKQYIEAGTIPTLVFGGKRNFQALCQGRLSRDQWRERRRSAFYSRGQANQHGPNGQSGNANTELRHREGNLFALAVRLPTGLGRGKDRWLTDLTLYIPDHNAALLTEWLSSGQAYSVEVRRSRDGQFYCHITLDLPEVEQGKLQNGIAGIDVNPQGLAVTLVHRDGNYRVSRWFPCPELVDAPATKRDWLIGNLVRDAVGWAKAQGVTAAAVEGLKFQQDHDTDKRFNRMSHNFVHRKMLTTVYTRCWKEQMVTLQVKPAFTSIIGRVKYAQLYGLNSHQAAAMAIARRAMGFKEAMPKPLEEAVFGTTEGQTSWYGWGKVAHWLAFIRRHAVRNGLNPDGWRLSDYLKYPVRPVWSA